MTTRDEKDTWLVVGLVALVLLAGGGAVAVYSKIRGIRNNNPGNVRLTGTKWQGMAATQTDGAFIQFIAPEWGIRAIARILKTYVGIGIGTVRGIITRWAPPIENNTDAYVNAVAASVGIAPDAHVDLDAHMAAIVKAIIKHENGVQPYDDETINRGIALA